MMWIFLLLLSLISPAYAQCSGQFAANTACGNNTGVAAQPKQIPITSIVAGVASLNGQSGTMTLGAGLSTSQIFNSPLVSPWFPVTGNNVIVQSTGTSNRLRNASFSSSQHKKFLDNDRTVGQPNNTIAGFTGVISGTTLTASSVTGTIQLFQRVTDAVNFTTNGTTAIGNNTLHFASTTGITTGMYVTDLTNPQAITGDSTVSSTTSTTVVLTGHVYLTSGNIVSPGVGSGDVIAFSNVLRGTEIVGLVSGSGGAGTYTVNQSQSVSSESMQSTGAWEAEGIYVIPVGSAGNSITCNLFGNGGAPNPGGGLICTANNNMTDIIFRFPLDAVDTNYVTCNLSAGPPGICLSTNQIIQPLTFQAYVLFSASYSGTPSIDAKGACVEAQIAGQALDGRCNQGNSWVEAYTDLPQVNMPGCFLIGSPNECPYAYTWVPNGSLQGYEVNFHCGAIPSGKECALMGMELKQTPGATCNGSSPSTPPCFNLNPGPLEIPGVVADQFQNMRFAQMIGTGLGTGFPGSTGATETTAAFASSTTNVLSTWPLQTTMRCNVWILEAKDATTCPPPRVYFTWGTGTVADYVFTSGNGTFAASAISVNNQGLNSVQFATTISGGTKGDAGYVSIGGGHADMILLDSAIIGD